MYSKWERGSGSTIFGLFIMLTCTTMVLFFTQTFIIQQQGQSAQTAADSISDATAVYASNEGADYEEASAYARNVQSMVEDQTGVKTTELEMNQELFEEDQKVDIKLRLNGSYTDPLYYLQDAAYQREHSAVLNYKVPGKAQTEFTGIGQGLNGALEWALQIANDDSHWYLWGGVGPDHYDCSGFVGNALVAAQILPGPMYTRQFDTSIEAFVLMSHGFVEVTSQVNLRTGEGMLPGDVLLRREADGGHTEFYYGSGQQIGAHSTPDNVAERASSISIVPLYQSWERVFRYIG